MSIIHSKFVDKILQMHPKHERIYAPYNGFYVPHNVILQGTDSWVPVDILTYNASQSPHWFIGHGAEELQYSPDKNQMCLLARRPPKGAKLYDAGPETRVYILFSRKEI